MATEKVVPTDGELKAFDLTDPNVVELIYDAQQSDADDRKLTVLEAVKKYKKALFWAMFLSTSLIMEGYDLVIVSTKKGDGLMVCVLNKARSLLSTVKHNSKKGSAYGTKEREKGSSRPSGNLGCQTRLSSASCSAS